MPFESVRGLTFIVGADVAQGRFVRLDSNAAVIVGTEGIPQTVIGVSLEAGLLANPETGNPDSISVAAIDGARVEMEAGGVIAVGDQLTSDSVGRAIALTAGVTTRQIAIAVQISGATGQFIEVLLIRQGGFGAQT